MSRPSNSYVGFDGIGDVALFVRRLMKLLFIRWRRQLLSTVCDLGVERDEAHPRNTSLVPGHHADRFVLVVIDLKSQFRGHVEIGQHVATRNCRDERLFRVHVRRV